MDKEKKTVRSLLREERLKKTTTTMQDMTVITESGEEGCGAKGACSVQPGGGKYSCNQGNHTFSHKGSVTADFRSDHACLFFVNTMSH